MKTIFLVTLLFAVVAVNLCLLCPDDWKQWRNKCYQRDHKWTTFAQRVEICKKSNAYPLTINSDEENAFIMKTFTRCTLWLGGKKVKGTNQWKWVDGRPIKYTNWNKGEPNNANNNEECIQYYNNGPHAGKWNDYPCTVREHGVCEFYLDKEFDSAHLNETDREMTNLSHELN